MRRAEKTTIRRKASRLLTERMRHARYIHAHSRIRTWRIADDQTIRPDRVSFLCSPSARTRTHDVAEFYVITWVIRRPSTTSSARASSTTQAPAAAITRLFQRQAGWWWRTMIRSVDNDSDGDRYAMWRRAATHSLEPQSLTARRIVSTSTAYIVGGITDCNLLFTGKAILRRQYMPRQLWATDVAVNTTQAMQLVSTNTALPMCRIPTGSLDA